MRLVVSHYTIGKMHARSHTSAGSGAQLAQAQDFNQ